MKKYFLNKNKIIKNIAGYTLVELLIATTVFTIVALGAFTILSASQSGYNRVSNSRITTDNINLVLDTMSREIKFGSEYRCANREGNFLNTPNYNALINLDSSSSITKCNAFSFIPQGEINKNIVYYYNINNSTINQVRYKRNNPSEDFVKDNSFGDVSLTSEGFKVENLNFSLSGLSKIDYLQPKVLLTTTGVIDVSVNKAGSTISTSTFSAQTMITQRLLDN